MLNVGAPFMVFYGGLAQLGRIELLIALNLGFAVGKTTQLILMYWASPGLFVLPQLLPATLVSLLAYALGMWLSARNSEASFKRWMIGFQCVMAALLLARAGWMR